MAYCLSPISSSCSGFQIWKIICSVLQHYFQSGPSINRLTGAGASKLEVEWTDQHGCGGNEDTDPQKQNCNMVLQFMCEDAIDNIPRMYFFIGLNAVIKGWGLEGLWLVRIKQYM